MDLFIKIDPKDVFKIDFFNMKSNITQAESTGEINKDVIFTYLDVDTNIDIYRLLYMFFFYNTLKI